MFFCTWKYKNRDTIFVNNGHLINEFFRSISNKFLIRFYQALVYIIKQLFCSLSSYMTDSQLGATRLVGYQRIYDSSSQNNC
jgi:hypothetical protein